MNIIFVLPDGTEKSVLAEAGQRLLDVAQSAGLPMEGACEGSLACSTCHVIVDEAWFNSLPPASSEEEDMLDLTLGVTVRSRLACQIQVSEAIEGLKVALPASTYNLSGA